MADPDTRHHDLIGDERRLAVVRAVWQTLADRGDPSDRFAPGARIIGSTFGAGFDDDRPATVEERMAVVREQRDRYVIRLVNAYAAPRGRVVAVGAAGWRGATALVAVVYTFDGELIATSRVFHHAAEAFRWVGIAEAPGGWQF